MFRWYLSQLKESKLICIYAKLRGYICNNPLLETENISAHWKLLERMEKDVLVFQRSIYCWNFKCSWLPKILPTVCHKDRLADWFNWKNGEEPVNSTRKLWDMDHHSVSARCRVPFVIFHFINKDSTILFYNNTKQLS